MRLFSHGNDYEEVLCHKYVSGDNTIQLSDYSLDPSLSARKRILFQVSKVFDLQGLTFPFTT